MLKSIILLSWPEGKDRVHLPPELGEPPHGSLFYVSPYRIFPEGLAPVEMRDRLPAADYAGRERTVFSDDPQTHARFPATMIAVGDRLIKSLGAAAAGLFSWWGSLLRGTEYTMHEHAKFSSMWPEWLPSGWLEWKAKRLPGGTTRTFTAVKRLLALTLDHDSRGGNDDINHLLSMAAVLAVQEWQQRTKTETTWDDGYASLCIQAFDVWKVRV